MHTDAHLMFLHTVGLNQCRTITDERKHMVIEGWGLYLESWAHHMVQGYLLD